MKSRWNVRVATVALATTALSMLGGSVPVVAGPVTGAGASASVRLMIDPLKDADQVVRAWGRGNRAAVEVLATPSVATHLFGYSTPGGVSWRRIAWDGTAGTVFVVYHDDVRGGTVTLGVSDVLLSQGHAQAVYGVQFSQVRPVDAAGYADRLVRAWGRGDRIGASVYATEVTVSVLFGHADPGGRFWVRTRANGAAGTVFVTYHDDIGRQLVLRVADFAAQDAQRHAVYEADFGR